MKLEINLADREEIAAAVPLLQLILDGTTAPASVPREALTGTQLRAAYDAGGAVVPAPLAPAPSTAGAILPAIAPVGAPVTSTAANVPQPPAPPAPPVAAPMGSAAAPMTPAPAVDLDSSGLPWDERIHASTKSKLQNGTWKGKRGVDSTLVVQVEAELRARAANAGSGMAAELGADAAKLAAMGVDPLSGQALQLTPAQAFGGAVAPAPLPIAPPAATLPPVPPVAPSEPATFEQLMTRISPAVASGAVPPTVIQAACAAVGLASVAALQQNPAYVAMVWASIKQAHPAV